MAANTDPLAIFTSNDITSAVNGWETSGARAGNVVFYSGNWFAAYSTDAGKTFTSVNAYAGFTGLPKGEGLCCDQQVLYVPQIDRFVWVRQTNQATASGENRYRVAVASPAQVAASHGTQWTYWDLTPATFGVSGKKPAWWFDFDGIQADKNNLFLTFNVIGSGAGIVARFPLSTLASGHSLSGRFFFPTRGDFRVAQGSGSRAYFAQEVSNSQLAVYYWDDSSTSIVGRTVNVSSISGSYGSVLPSGENWLGANTKISGRILGATQAGNRIWFAWTGGKSSAFAQAHIEIAIISASNLSLVTERYIYNPGFAFAYPDLATNSNGEVGLSYAWGGGRYQARTGVALLTGSQRFVNTSNNGLGSGGHYMTIRQDYPNTRLFTAALYFQQLDSGQRVNHPQFIVFGRSSDGR